MIPKLTFPINKLQLDVLYQDKPELERIKARSLSKAALSKVSAVYHDLYFPAPPQDRPYIFSSMVLSLDGKMAFPDNPQGPVVASANSIDADGGLADFWVLNVLRAHADAIVVGAKTLVSEPDLVLACLDADLALERKERLGKEDPHPISIIVSLDGKDVPKTHSIFSVPEIRTIIATSHQGGLFLKKQSEGEEIVLLGPYSSRAEVDAQRISRQMQNERAAHRKIVLMTGEDEPDARLLLFVLRKIGISHLLVESPTYMWLLMNQRMLDEFFVDYSTLFIGGTITPGYGNGFSYLDHPHSQFLVIALHRNGFLFTRQKLVYGLAAPR
ncbi:MAG TPA: dihydrofolate reductase family protein [Anaerolineales bacterium]|nr:dihydrofolate reductase family protein [Anaerolineales bacterium]